MVNNFFFFEHYKEYFTSLVGCCGLSKFQGFDLGQSDRLFPISFGHKFHAKSLGSMHVNLLASSVTFEWLQTQLCLELYFKVVFLALLNLITEDSTHLRQIVKSIFHLDVL